MTITMIVIHTPEHRRRNDYGQDLQTSRQQLFNHFSLTMIIWSSVARVLLITSPFIERISIRMNKSDLIHSVSEQTGVARHMLEVVFGRIFNTIETALAEGDQVAIHGFGTFSVKTRAAREGRNPRTGEAISIPESRVVVFKPAKSLKDTMNR